MFVRCQHVKRMQDGAHLFSETPTMNEDSTFLYIFRTSQGKTDLTDPLLRDGRNVVCASNLCVFISWWSIPHKHCHHLSAYFEYPNLRLKPPPGPLFSGNARAPPSRRLRRHGALTSPGCCCMTREPVSAIRTRPQQLPLQSTKRMFSWSQTRQGARPSRCMDARLRNCAILSNPLLSMFALCLLFLPISLSFVPNLS